MRNKRIKSCSKKSEVYCNIFTLWKESSCPIRNFSVIMSPENCRNKSDLLLCNDRANIKLRYSELFLTSLFSLPCDVTYFANAICRIYLVLLIRRTFWKSKQMKTRVFFFCLGFVLLFFFFFFLFLGRTKCCEILRTREYRNSYNRRKLNQRL